MKIEMPTSCPSCDGKLELINSQLFCKNKTDCPAQNTALVQNYCKKLKIKGFGPSTIDKLGLASITDLYNVSLETLTEVLGSTLATKLDAERNNAKTLSLSAFIAAVSIPLVGDTAGRKLGQVISQPSQLSSDICISAGIGQKATSHIMAWMRTQWLGGLDNLPIKFIERVEKPVTNQTECLGTVCITGKLNNYKNRVEASDFLASQGFVVKTSVTKLVDYLICEDATKTNSSAYKKAEAANIPILSIEELLQKLY